MKKYFFILVGIFLISCNFNKTHENRESDKQDAEKVTEKFYSLMNDDNREKVFKLFSNKFFQITNQQHLNQMIDWTNKEGGKPEKFTLTNWKTFIIEGSNPKSEYSLTYYVKRKSINTQEIFSLQKENNIIKIVGYKINLDIK